MNFPIAANVLGTLGAVCWSIQLIPQIIINYRRRHHTEGLQSSMMLLWACAGVPLGAYNISRHFNVALLVQPQVLTFLSLVTWVQCCYYGSGWSLKICLASVLSIGVLFAGMEFGWILALKHAQARSLSWPETLTGILSTVLLSAGVLRHYYDIYVHRTVRGISFLFVGIDAAGDVFSLISVFFQPKLDVLGIAIYATEFVLWCGVFASGGWYNLIPWMRARISKREGEREIRPQGHVGAVEAGFSHDVQLGRTPSSRTVFRTSGSITRAE